MSRILILEQDADTQCMLGRFLARNGYGIAYASDGSDAVAEARNCPYDLFLLDVADGGSLAAGAFLRSLRGGGEAAPSATPPVLILTSDSPGQQTPLPEYPRVQGAVNKRSRNFFDELLDQVRQALAMNPAGRPGR